MDGFPIRLRALAALAVVAVLGAISARNTRAVDSAAAQTQGGFAEFVEPDFPFIVSTVDAREVGPRFPDDNVATRGLVLQTA